MQIHASIRNLLPLKFKTVTVIRCKHLACFGHIQLEPSPSRGECVQRIGNTGVQEGSVFMGENEEKMKAAVLKPIGIQATE